MDFNSKLSLFCFAFNRHSHFLTVLFKYLYELPRNLMSKYFAIARATWQEYLTYRGNLFLEVIGGFIAQVVIIALWYAIYGDLNTTTVGNFTLSEMITYLIAAGVINSFILHSSQGDEINDDINRGYLSNFLAKPLNIPAYWLTRDLCRRILTLILGIGEYFLLLVIFSGFLILPSSLSVLILTIIAILLAGILHYFLFYIFSVIAFWMDQTWGPRFVMRVVMVIATGSIIPLSLFPANWQSIFNLLPFKFLIYFPLQIYLGKITSGEILAGLATVLAWITALVAISVLVWNRGIKKYSAYGH